MAPRIVDILTTYTAYMRKKEEIPKKYTYQRKETPRGSDFFLSLEFAPRAQQDLLALKKPTIFPLLLEYSLSPKQDLDMDTNKSRLFGSKGTGFYDKVAARGYSEPQDRRLRHVRARGSPWIHT